MTKHECAVVMAYTGIAMLTGDDFAIFTKYCEDLLGRPIFTHEYPILAEEIKEKAKPDFLKLCKNAGQSKTIKLVPMTGTFFVSHVTDTIIKQEQIKERLIDNLAKAISNNGDKVMKISKTHMPEYGGVEYRADVVFVNMSEADYIIERSEDGKIH